MKLNELFEGITDQIDKEFNRLKNDQSFVNKIIVDILREEGLENNAENRAKLQQGKYSKYINDVIRKSAARIVRDRLEY